MLLVSSLKSHSPLSMHYSELSQATLEEQMSVSLPVLLRGPAGPVELKVDADHARRIVEYLAPRVGLPSNPSPPPTG